MATSPLRADSASNNVLHSNALAASRRAVLAGLAVSTVASIPVAAPAIARVAAQGSSDMNMHTRFPQVSELEERMAESRAAADARFWELHAKWNKLNTAWEADNDDSDENWERWSDLVTEALDDMLMQGVFSARAILAKFLSVDDPVRLALPEPVGTLGQMLEWDLGRVAMQELASSQKHMALA